MYKNLDTFQSIPFFIRTLDAVTLLFASYKDFGSFEVCPVNTFYSFNGVERFRLRVGGRTTLMVNASPMQFVKNDSGIPITNFLDNGSYTEGSVGVGNIFKILRVDLVKRFF